MMVIDCDTEDEHVRRRMKALYVEKSTHTGRYPETTESVTRHGPFVDRSVACGVDSNPY